MHCYIFVYSHVVCMMCRIQSAFDVTMCEAGASRFREPKTVEEVILVHKAVHQSTKYKNKWATSIFYEWQTGWTVQIAVLVSGGLFLLFNEFRYSAMWRGF